MKNFTKRIFATLLAALMVVTLASSCSSSPDDATGSTATDATEGGDDTATGGGELQLSGPNEFPIVSEPASFSMFISLPSHIEDYETNDVTLFMEEATGVGIEFQVAAAADFETQLNLTLSSGDYPEVINAMNAGAPDVTRFGVSEKIFIPIEDYITPEIMPNYTALMDDSMLSSTRMIDGSIYGIANVNQCYHCNYYKKMWINKDIVAELGMELPTTTDEFTELCEAYLAEYPNGVALGGATDAWGGAFDEFIMGAFAYSPNNAGELVVTKDGAVESVAVSDGYKEGLRYLKSLYDIGALYDGSMTQNLDQLKALVNQEGSPVLAIPGGFHGLYIDNISNYELYSQYEALAPLEGPDGTQNIFYDRHAGVIPNMIILTDKVENPEMILKWTDWLFDVENGTAVGFGPVEGTHYVMNPEGMVGINGEPAVNSILVPYSKELQNVDWQDMLPGNASNDVRLGLATDPDEDRYSPEGFELMLYEESANKMAPYQDNGDYETLPPLVFTQEDNDELSIIGVELESYIAENKLAFITGAKSLDDDWDAYVEGINNAGLPTYIEIYQAGYDNFIS